MNKVLNWKKKIDTYYLAISADQLKIDLEEAGFKVNNLKNVDDIRNYYPSSSENAFISSNFLNEEIEERHITKILTF